TVTSSAACPGFRSSVSAPRTVCSYTNTRCRCTSSRRTASSGFATPPRTPATKSLSQWAGSPPRDDAQGQVHHREVGIRPLLPADENAPKAVHPAVRALYDPVPRFEARFPLDRPGLLAAGSNVDREPEHPDKLADLVKV